ncbi:MAG: peptide deformylase [Bacteriovoracaceae bacterium]
MSNDKLCQNYKLEGESLDIHTYPDPILTRVAAPVTVFDQELETLCKNMLFTMYHAPGIGLAAPQVGKSIRLFVLDVTYKRDTIEHEDGSEEFQLSKFKPIILINPKISAEEGETTYQEGCLSVPGVYEDVKRYEKITVEYQNLSGEKKTMKADGLLAICIQHENDHLEGIVFIERLSAFKKNFFKKKLTKNKKSSKAI